MTSAQRALAAAAKLTDFMLDSAVPIGPFRSRDDYPEPFRELLAALKALDPAQFAENPAPVCAPCGMPVPPGCGDPLCPNTEPTAPSAPSGTETHIAIPVPGKDYVRLIRNPRAMTASDGPLTQDEEVMLALHRALLSEREARREAEQNDSRYRWLRSKPKRSMSGKKHAGDIMVMQFEDRTAANALYLDALDAAIDAAPAKETKR